MRLYTQERLAKLPADAADRLVAQLCRRASSTPASGAATLVETWVERYNPPKNIVSNLTDVDDANLRNAIGELQVATALDKLGFSVDMRRRFDRPNASAMTPDVFASKNGLGLIVEVVTKRNDRRSDDLSELLRQIAADLESRLNLPPQGFLSLSVLPTAATKLDTEPRGETMSRITTGLNAWLSRPDPFSGGYRNLDGPLPLSGSLMHGDKREVVLTGPGGSLGQSRRIGRTISEKIKKYAALATPETKLTVAVVAGGWKVTEGQVVEALFGQEQINLDPLSGETISAQYNGRGAAVAGGPFDDVDPRDLSGVWFLESVGQYVNDPPSLLVRISFIHSPYARHPIDPDDLGHCRQLVVSGPHLVWREGNRTLDLC